jgi:hypothetical protein
MRLDSRHNLRKGKRASVQIARDRQRLLGPRTLLGAAIFSAATPNRVESVILWSVVSAC